jgi:hypothetical protein
LVLLRDFLQFPVTSSVLDWNTLLFALPSNTWILILISVRRKCILSFIDTVHFGKWVSFQRNTLLRSAGQKVETAHSFEKMTHIQQTPKLRTQ